MKKEECRENQSLTGKDEMNLAEFPITLLSKRQGGNIKTIEFSDTITGEDGKSMKREWVVTGSDKFGLPLAVDNDVLLAVLLCGIEQDFATRKIYFTKYRLCDLMMWEPGGSGYKRIEDAFDRLKGVIIKAKNALWDNERKGYVSKSFGIIDDYELFESSKPGKPKRDSFALSYINLNEVIYESIKSGYIKKIELKKYFSLESAVAKRLFRYLDKKKYDGKKTFTINLFKLAEAHLGLKKTKYASQIKQQLAPAHQELITIDFLESAEYHSTTDKTSEKVIYRFSSKEAFPEPVEQKKEDPPGNKLLSRLLKIGITRKAAKQLLKDHKEDDIMVQIKALAFRNAKDAAAVLIASIKEGWELPEKCIVNMGREEKENIEREKRLDEERIAKDHHNKMEEYMGSLSPRELAALTEEAKDLAKKEGGDYFTKRELSPHMVNGYMKLIVKRRLEIPETIEESEWRKDVRCEKV